jgi:hypothetical protein
MAPTSTSLPDITGPSFPEDFEQGVVLAPLDDDGGPAVQDSPPTVVGTNCDIADLSADGLTFVMVPKMSAKSGDSVTAAVTMTSEGDTVTQNIVSVLTPGGVASSAPAFGAAVKSTRRT